eukprot:5457566-Pyramimonas_sp.AAC.1
MPSTVAVALDQHAELQELGPEVQRLGHGSQGVPKPMMMHAEGRVCAMVEQQRLAKLHQPPREGIAELVRGAKRRSSRRGRRLRLHPVASNVAGLVQLPLELADPRAGSRQPFVAGGQGPPPRRRALST